MPFLFPFPLRNRLLLLGCAACLTVRVAAQEPTVLIFHKENGYVHAATGAVVNGLKNDWTQHGMTVESTIDSLAFTPQNLARFDAIVFYNTNYRNGPLLAREQEAAFEAYVRAGGGFVGIHSAIPLNGTFEESVWPWYAQLYGARFRSHAPYRSAPMVIEDTTHFSTRGLPARITLPDEWYALQSNPRDLPGVRVLATVDETGFLPDSDMGGDHPVTWSRTFEGARAWMTVVGHDAAAFGNVHFRTHVRNGVLWTAGADSGTTALNARRNVRQAIRHPVRPVRHSDGRSVALAYRGARGEWIEVHVDGRAVTARRAPAVPAPWERTSGRTGNPSQGEEPGAKRK